VSEPSAATARYTVRVLGPFGVSRDGEALDTGSWPRRSQTLLKLLVTADQSRRLRDEVVDILWPDSGPEAGASNLRYVLHALRRDLGGGDPPPIDLDREWVGLSGRYAWEIDLRRFEELAGQADGSAETIEEAMVLYRGEPLVEDRYEDWALPIREQAERIWRTLGLRLASEYRRRGMQQEAIGRTERLLERDPLDEEAMQELLPALEAMGRRAEAVRRYRDFERRLAEELGVAPSDETRAVLDRPATRTEAPPPDQVERSADAALRPPPTGRFLGALPSGPIVARKDELARLAAAAKTVGAGSGRFIVLVGEPGAGKTRLAQEAMVRLRDQGFLVLTGRCSSRAQALALHPGRSTVPAARVSARDRSCPIRRGGDTPGEAAGGANRGHRAARGARAGRSADRTGAAGSGGAADRRSALG
jgi:DNA-binding SARP family transcriptional activator